MLEWPAFGWVAAALILVDDNPGPGVLDAG
jgi:hypothetical protein